jgi:serralysin
MSTVTNLETGSDTITSSAVVTIAVNSAVEANLNSASDIDYFRFAVTTGQTYSVQSGTWDFGASQDTALTVIGQQTWSDGSSGPAGNDGYGGKVTFTANYTGFAEVRVSTDSSKAGHYMLTVASGTTPFIPEANLNEIAAFITNGYWSERHWTASTIKYNITGLTSARQDLFRQAFAAIDQIVATDFVESTDTGAGVIMVDDTTAGASIQSYSLSAGVLSGASINLGATWNGGESSAWGYAQQTAINLIEQALGLSQAGFNVGGTRTYGADRYFNGNTHLNTILSYFGQGNEEGATTATNVVTPQMADIIALQRLYAAETTSSGNSTYGFNATDVNTTIYGFDTSRPAQSFTIYDSGGLDTLDLSGFSQSQTVDLVAGQGHHSSVGNNGVVKNVSIAVGTVIENAVGGSAADTLGGNYWNNVLKGNAGNDTLYGYEGTDTAIYSGIRSLYTVTQVSGTHWTVSGNGEGTDDLYGVEKLQFSDQVLTIGAGAHADLSIFSTYQSTWTLKGMYTTSGTTIQNTGAAASLDTSLSWWLSNDNTLNTGSDTWLGSFATSPIAASGTQSIAHPARQWTTAGTFYTFVLADTQNATNEAAWSVAANQGPARQTIVVDHGTLDGNGFDATFYRQQNPDVVSFWMTYFGHANDSDMLWHYQNTGWHEGRDPNALFGVNHYLAYNPDVAAAGIDPLYHYVNWGWQEGRDPGPHLNLAAWLTANPDVDAANLDPMWFIYNVSIPNNENRPLW